MIFFLFGGGYFLKKLGLSPLPGTMDFLKRRINEACDGVPAWKVVVFTAGGTYTAIKLYGFLFKDESLFLRAKHASLRLVRKIPHVKEKIQSELVKVNHMLSEEMNNNIENTSYILELPKNGWTHDEIIKSTEVYCAYGKFDWSAGYTSGTVYNGSKELTDLCTQVYSASAWSNPLHSDVFPGIRKMEAEVVRMCCDMYNGSKDSCGTMTTGGTESIVLACKAFRDYAVKVKGITNPEMLVPITAHAAFDKGAQLLGIRIKHVPVDPKTMRVDVKAMKKMITKRTCMLAGSAPQFPHGVIDPIEEISKLGVKYNIPVHVDACLGGFLIPFMKEAGYPIPAFDFQLEGVCSISCDTHKYGFAPKGSSVILYSNQEYRRSQYFSVSDWPGGIYTTPTISGSRPGGIIAACWAAMVYYGRDGYVQTTKEIISTAKKIEQQCREIEGIKVMGKPDVSVVAFTSDHFNIYTFGDMMTEKGWNLNALQFPSCIHIAVTLPHTKAGVADRFISDVTAVAKELISRPPSNAEGSAAMYGMAQSLPDRSIVDEITGVYLDVTYSTERRGAAKN